MEKVIPLYNIPLGNVIGRQGIRNGIVNASIHGPAVMKRPVVGSSVKPSAASILPGIFYDPNMDAVLTVDASDVLRFGTTTIGTIANIDQSGRLSWAQSEQYVYIHNSRYNVTSSESDYVINRVTPSVAQITDAQHPIKDSRGSCEGVVYLDGYWFVADGLAYDTSPSARSRIYNSNLGDPTAWTATGYIEAGTEGDPTIGIAKHHNHLVAFGTRTIQFFYNAGNPVGSPLAPRLDVVYNVGLSQNNLQSAKYDRIAQYQDLLFFEGQPGGLTPIMNTRGLAGDIYMMDNFKIKSITTPEIKQMVAENYAYVGLSVVHYQSRPLLLVQLGNASTYANLGYCLVYDIVLGLWYLWDTDVFNASGRYVLDGDYASGYVRAINGVTPGTADADGASTATYTWSVTTPPINDLEIPKIETTGKLKTCNYLSVLGRNQVSGSGASLSVSYTDDDYQNFSTARTITLEDGSARLHRLGSFRQRAFRVTEATSDLDVEPHSLVLDVSPHMS